MQKKVVRICRSLGKLGSAFGRTDVFMIFIFEPPDFFADFVAGCFRLTPVFNYYIHILFFWN